MLDNIPGSPNDPLFQIPTGSTFAPLTDSVARKHLKKVQKVLKIPSPLTFHLFRKSGTTWAFQHGVPLQQIMLHGTWTSDCIWRYVSTLPQHISPVAATFKQHLHIVSGCLGLLLSKKFVHFWPQISLFPLYDGEYQKFVT